MKVSAVSEANWAMTCAFEQSKCERVAYGGLDNFCRVFDIKGELSQEKMLFIQAEDMSRLV